MEEKHYIEWIELLDGELVYKKFLKPREKPEAVLKLRQVKLWQGVTAIYMGSGKPLTILREEFLSVGKLNLGQTTS